MKPPGSPEREWGRMFVLHIQDVLLKRRKILGLRVAKDHGLFGTTGSVIVGTKSSIHEKS